MREDWKVGRVGWRGSEGGLEGGEGRVGWRGSEGGLEGGEGRVEGQ